MTSFFSHIVTEYYSAQLTRNILPMVYMNHLAKIEQSW